MRFAMRAASCRANRAALLAALVGGVVSPAFALDWNAEAFALYGGTYANECANAGAVHVRIDKDAVVLTRGARSVTGRSLDPSASFFGSQPPADFQMAILAQPSPPGDLVVAVFRDRQGRSVTLQADPKTMAAVGLKANDATAYRDCDAERRQRDGDAAMAAQSAAASSAQAAALASPLADPAFKAAYLKALGSRASTPWLARMDGPSTGQKSVVLDGKSYLSLAYCKAHDCGDNNAVLLYSKADDKVYALVFEGGQRTTMLGTPPASVTAQLQQTWRTEWHPGK